MRGEPSFKNVFYLFYRGSLLSCSDLIYEILYRMRQHQNAEKTRNRKESINKLPDTAEEHAPVRRDNLEIVQEKLGSGTDKMVQQQNPRDIGFAVCDNVKNQVHAVEDSGGD